jgi:hypothetical protein
MDRPFLNNRPTSETPSDKARPRLESHKIARLQKPAIIDNSKNAAASNLLDARPRDLSHPQEGFPLLLLNDSAILPHHVWMVSSQQKCKMCFK